MSEQLTKIIDDDGYSTFKFSPSHTNAEFEECVRHDSADVENAPSKFDAQLLLQG